MSSSFRFKVQQMVASLPSIVSVHLRIADLMFLVIPEELEADARDALGSENLVFETIEAGHELAITKADEIVQLIARHWRL